MIDINPRHLEIVKAILQRHVPDAEVRAFGSRVTRTAKDHSDLDLAIVGEGPMDFRSKALLEEAFEESDLPFRVDVVDLAAVSEDFRRIIEQKYIVVQERGGRKRVVARKSGGVEASHSIDK
jgi:predicted nucleotidyltransferase